MKIRKILTILTLIVSVGYLFQGCAYMDEASLDIPVNPYSNKLTVGMGWNGFNLTGETSSFIKGGSNVQVYWKLESADDLNGSNVVINIEKNVSGSYSVVSSPVFPNSSATGHLMLSFVSLSTTGNYRLTGLTVTPNKTVASCLLSVI